jgi:hypothetical protein
MAVTTPPREPFFEDLLGRAAEKAAFRPQPFSRRSCSVSSSARRCVSCSKLPSIESNLAVSWTNLLPVLPHVVMLPTKICLVARSAATRPRPGPRACQAPLADPGALLPAPFERRSASICSLAACALRACSALAATSAAAGGRQVKMRRRQPRLYC